MCATQSPLNGKQQWLYVHCKSDRVTVLKQQTSDEIQSRTMKVGYVIYHLCELNAFHVSLRSVLAHCRHLVILPTIDAPTTPETIYISLLHLIS